MNDNEREHLRNKMIGSLCPSCEINRCKEDYADCNECDKILHKILDEFEVTIRADERNKVVKQLNEINMRYQDGTQKNNKTTNKR